MKIRSAELKTVCGFTSTLPASVLPEIAFAGRSNVGKSSLINSLMQRRRLARVGETPGKTRTINFYEVDALVKRPAKTDGSIDTDSSIQAAGPSSAEAVPMTEESVLFQLVDLPGYGYAKVSHEEKARWGRMIERYLADRRDLRAVFLLLVDDVARMAYSTEIPIGLLTSVLGVPFFIFIYRKNMRGW